MKSFGFTFLIVIAASVSSGQTTEKFLKLQRIVVLDSSKVFSVIQSQNGYSRLFSISTPNNVLWKITKLVCCAIPGQNSTINWRGGAVGLIRINNSWIPPTIDEFIPASITSTAAVDNQFGAAMLNGINISRPLWVKGQSTLELRILQPFDTLGQPIFPIFSLYLVAEEYLVE